MAYTKDLGQVKGDKGVAFKPQIKEDTMTKIVIEWIPTDNNYTAEVPEDTTIQKSLILPTIEDNILSWYQANPFAEAYENIVLPEPINVKGEKGDTGNTKIDVLIYESLSQIEVDDTSTLYYIGNDNDGYSVYVYDPNYTNKYRKVGLSSIDLSNYYTKSEIDTLLQEYATIEYVDSRIAQAIDLIDNSIIPRLG